MALSYHYFFMSILYIIQTLLWIVLNSSLMKITDLMLSTFKYLLFTKSKILGTMLALPYGGLFILMDFLDCLTSLWGPDFVSAFVYFCIVL